jgi:hypothetical protein
MVGAAADTATAGAPALDARTAAMLGGTGASAEGAGARGGRQPSEDPTTRKCYRCGQAGHVIASCPQAPNNVSAVTSRQRRHGHNREVVNIFTDYGN